MTVNEPIESLQDAAITAATAGGRETLKVVSADEWGSKTRKAPGTGFDPVTAADRACERIIRDTSRSAIP